MSKPSGQPELMPYGLWQSNVEIESMLDQPSPPAYPFEHGDILYWLESLPAEKGRNALMRESCSADPVCLTPRDFNIRTGVHEYGGRCFCIFENRFIFNNYKDGNLYQQTLEPDSTPGLLTVSNKDCCGFADLVTAPGNDFVVAVMERTREGEQNQNCLVGISLEQVENDNQPGVADICILAQGADFYANPVLSPDGNNIAWFEWDHPNMPWDQSRLVYASLEFQENRLTVGNNKIVINESRRSVCQLGFMPDQSLIFASDSDTCDYWNLFKYDKLSISQLTDRAGEFGEAHWIFGQRRWQAVSEKKLIATVTSEHGDELVAIDTLTGDCTVLHREYSACSHLQAISRDDVLFVAHYSDRPAEIVRITSHSGRIMTLKSGGMKTGQVQDNTTGTKFDGYSEPVLVKFPTSNRSTAYGYYYPPFNRKYTAPANTLPPLLILVHGGPTSKSTSELVKLKQYFCSLGFALLDVNHRGSTGHGRKFRQSLLGNWGEYDADDILNGIKFVVDNQWVDGNLVFIRGGSAGGYAVLRSLTRFPQRFTGGACYYGIGNLITLSKITHKFESKYTDNLVGEVFDPVKSENSTSRFVTRSPIFQIDNLSSPLIIFQGEEDKVVPPDVSRELVKILKTKGIKHSYTEYPGEGHGFRQTKTRVDSLRKETAFFAEIIAQSPGVVDRTQNRESRNLDDNGTKGDDSSAQ